MSISLDTELYRREVEAEGGSSSHNKSYEIGEIEMGGQGEDFEFGEHYHEERMFVVEDQKVICSQMYWMSPNKKKKIVTWAIPLPLAHFVIELHHDEGVKCFSCIDTIHVKVNRKWVMKTWFWNKRDQTLQLDADPYQVLIYLIHDPETNTVVYKVAVQKPKAY